MSKFRTTEVQTHIMTHYDSIGTWLRIGNQTKMKMLRLKTKDFRRRSQWDCFQKRELKKSHLCIGYTLSASACFVCFAHDLKSEQARQGLAGFASSPILPKLNAIVVYDMQMLINQQVALSYVCSGISKSADD